MWEYRAQVVKVHDGDTVTVRLDLGFNLRLEIPLRLGDATYAPELSQPGGVETRDFAYEWLVDRGLLLTGLWPFVVTTARMPKADREVTTLGRYVGILTSAKGESLNQAVKDFVAQNNYGHGIGDKTTGGREPS